MKMQRQIPLQLQEEAQLAKFHIAATSTALQSHLTCLFLAWETQDATPGAPSRGAAIKHTKLDSCKQMPNAKMSLTHFAIKVQQPVKKKLSPLKVAGTSETVPLCAKNKVS